PEREPIPSPVKSSPRNSSSPSASIKRLRPKILSTPPIFSIPLLLPCQLRSTPHSVPAMLDGRLYPSLTTTSSRTAFTTHCVWAQIGSLLARSSQELVPAPLRPTLPTAPRQDSTPLVSRSAASLPSMVVSTRVALPRTALLRPKYMMMPS